MTISGRKPLSTVDYAKQKQETLLAALVPCACLSLHRNHAVSELGHFEVNIFVKTAETDKKKQ